jgi:hypothetical protein
MLWKVFSGLAAIALAIGVYFSYQTKGALRSEMDLEKRAKDNYETLTKKLTEGAEIKTKRDKDLEDRKAELNTVKADLEKVTTETDQKLKEVDVVKNQLDAVNKQLAALEDQISKAGDIKKLMAQIDELKKQKEAAEATIANQQQQLVLADADVAKFNAEITRLDEVDKRQRAGVVEPGFTARVSQPYQNFGFVILNKGNLGGMFANAMLDVKRGSRVVAKLKVRDVEQAQSVADLIPGTLAQGDSIRSGDLVVAAKVAPPPPAPVAPPTGTGTTPAAPGTEPFAPATPGMAPPTPAAPAPAANDPFAAAPGGMAPAAPAAPASDPFAPQPPAGGAPATPPAPGTPAPTGADPFAPQPPAGGATPPTPPAPPATPPQN